MRMRTRSVALVLVSMGAAWPALSLWPDPPAAQAKDTVADAEKLLGNTADWNERVRGLEMLDEMKGNSRAETLAKQALKDEDWSVGIRACATLGKIGTGESADALADAAVHGEIQLLRDAAADALLAIDATRGTDALLDRAAKYPRDDKLRRRAIDAAGRIAPAQAASRLSSYRKAKEQVVAAAAVRALGRIALRNPAAQKEILADIDDSLTKRADRRGFLSYAAACEAVAAIDTPEARNMALREIRDRPDDDQYVQERIARGLAKHDAAKVAEAWVSALEYAKKPEEIRRLLRLAARISLPAGAKYTDLLAHKEDRVRTEAARAIGCSGARETAPAVTKLLDDKAEIVRLEAVTALARILPFGEFLALGERIRKDSAEQVRLQFVVEIADIRRHEAIPALKAYLDDPGWRVLSATAATIGTLGIAEDMPLLVPLTTHKDWKIRGAAFEGLSRLRAREAIPLFADGLTDKDPVVRGTCLAALQILSGERFGFEPPAWKEWYEKKGSGLNLVKKSRLAKAAETEAAKDRYAPITPEYAIEVLQKARILVVEGAWDKVQIVLGHLKIPHTLLRAQTLKEKGLNPNQIVLVNCEGSMDKDTQERIRWFVNVGGALMTTDWALTKTVKPCFPGYVDQFSGANTGNDVVVIEEARADHPLTQGCFGNAPALQWWLEIQAFPITVLWPERCDVIVDSAEMKQKYGSSPMAVDFRWGLGHVQHSLSHFFLQEEGMQQASAARDRMIFAADNLGISLERIRKLKDEGGFEGGINHETMKKIAPDYSMFRMIVNVVRQKSDWVESL